LMEDLGTVPPPARRGAIGGKEKEFRGRKIPWPFEMKK
jgi:hypothetical protein